MRSVLIGDYCTGLHGWTLTSCQLAQPEWRSNLIEVPGLDGVIDASTALTGDVCFAPRALEITLENSVGTRTERGIKIAALINDLAGKTMKIVLPDDQEHYVVGRINIALQYNDLAHAALSVSASCDPWRYRRTITKIARSDLGADYKQLRLPNERRPIIPTITVDRDTTLRWGNNDIAINAGTHRLPEIYLAAGAHTLEAKVASGSGSISVEYQEACL